MSFFATQLIGFGAEAGHVAQAVVFDGTNDYLTRGGDLTGNADGKAGIVSVWLNFQGGDGSFQRIFASEFSGVRFLVDRTDTNKFRVFGANAAGTTILNLQSTTSITTTSGWVHILASWNLATTTAQLYLNDVNDANVVTATNDTIDYTQANWSAGGNGDGTFKLNAFIADAYLNLATSLDLSNASNRSKFILGRRPVFLGVDGSLPTGAQPIVFLSGNVASPFATNKGSGGGFTTNGTLTDASSSPS